MSNAIESNPSRRMCHLRAVPLGHVADESKNSTPISVSDLWLGLGFLFDLKASNKARGNFSQGASKLCIQSESSSWLLLLLRALLYDLSVTGVVLVPDVLHETPEIHKTST